MIRNEEGLALVAYMTNFGIASNNEAQLRAIIVGLKLCQEIDVNHVDIECDFMIVNWILNSRCIIWYLCGFWDELLALWQFFEVKITHIFREGNEVADFFWQRLVRKVCHNTFILVQIYLCWLVILFVWID